MTKHTKISKKDKELIDHALKSTKKRISQLKKENKKAKNTLSFMELREAVSILEKTKIKPKTFFYFDLSFPFVHAEKFYTVFPDINPSIGKKLDEIIKGTLEHDKSNA